MATITSPEQAKQELAQLRAIRVTRRTREQHKRVRQLELWLGRRGL